MSLRFISYSKNPTHRILELYKMMPTVTALPVQLALIMLGKP